MSEELQIAIEAAKKGAQKAISYFNTSLSISVKKDNSVVTIADKETEKVIINFIASRYKNAAFLGEESGGDIHAESFWIIDPIDGTRSYIHGIETWSILIALAINNKIELGVCYFPLMDVLLYAQRNKGTFVNEKKVSVSKIKNLSDAFVSYGSLRHFKNKSPIIRLSEICESVRSPEATYASYLVSKGSMDAHIDAYGKLWDFAPFKVIIEEAGGRITRLDGSEWNIEQKDGAITSNGLIHDQILEIMNKKMS